MPAKKVFVNECQTDDIKDEMNGVNKQIWTSDTKIEDIVADEVKTDSNCERKIYTETPLFVHLHKLILWMKIFGIFFVRWKRPDTGEIQRGRHFYYCLVILCIMIFNAVRSLTVYYIGDPFDIRLFFRLWLTAWSVECLAKYMCIFAGFYRQNMYPLLFTKWYEFGFSTHDKLLKKLLLVLTSLSLNFVVGNTLASASGYILSHELEAMYLQGTWRGGETVEYTIFIKILSGTIIFIGTGVAIFPIAFMLTMFTLTTAEFKLLSRELNKSIDETGKFTGNIRRFREWHENICTVVEILDDNFCWFVGTVFVANIPMCCFILYQFIFYIKGSIIHLVLGVFWLLFVLLHMGAVSIASGILNVYAHAPLSDVFRINITSELQEYHLDFTMFVQRLTGPPIGISVFKIFVIDRPTILTIFASLITYFVVLMQFNMPPAACECAFPGLLNGTVLGNHTTA